MNRTINILLGVFLVPNLLTTIFVGFDLPIQFLKVSGASLPYKEWIFIGFGLLIFALILFRSYRRWMGMRIVNQVKRFKWNAPVSKQRKGRVNLYQMIEAVIMAAVAIAIYQVSNSAWPASLAFLVGTFDNILFAIIGSSNKYRVGLSSKALIVADREVVLLYFTGLRKISMHQQSIYFDYIKGLQLSFPTDCINPEERAEFFDILEQQVDRERVFFSKKMK